MKIYPDKDYSNEIILKTRQFGKANLFRNFINVVILSKELDEPIELSIITKNIKFDK